MQKTAIINALARKGVTAYRIRERIWAVLRFGLLFGLGFIIVYPFMSKISSMLMSFNDLYDPIVWFIPREPTLDNIKNVIKFGEYWKSFGNTATISLLCAVLQAASTTLTSYGLARFRFKGRGILMALAVFTIVIPPQTVYVSLFMKFRFFDVFGILGALGLETINMMESLSPMVLLSVTALGLKNGIYILMLLQIFRNIPKELGEAACVDGAGVLRTFWSIDLPQVRPTMVTIFLLSFAWQWTDTFYSGLFYRNTPTLYNVLSKVRVIGELGAVNNNVISATMVNTAVMMIIFPLIVVYLFGQRYLIQGVERSGMVG